MKVITSILLLTLLPLPASANPLEIDLTAERRDYETAKSKRTLRITGLVLVAATAAAGGLTAYGFATASSTKSQLVAQQTPVDLAARRNLVSKGESANQLGVIALIAGLALGVGSACLLTVSF